jgi:hypothetical protein
VKLLRHLALLLIVLGSVTAASAQTTTFNGIVNDLTGTPIPSGNVAFTLRPGIDTTISGNARFTPTVVSCQIVNAAVSSTTGTGTITVTTPFSENWQIGDVIIFRGTADASLNASSVASPFTITGIGGGGTQFTFTLAGTHNNGAGGTVGGIYTNTGTGPCVVTQNSALNPAYTSYRVDIQPGGTTTSSFNTYAIGAGPIDISTIVPTPAQQPAYSFVDLFSNGQTISGSKFFTNQNNTYNGGTFTSPTINNATFNTTTATNWLLVTPTIQAPVFTTQPITFAGANNYLLTWANPAANRAISFTDPGGTDSFVWLNATQTIKNKTFDGSNTFGAALFPGAIYNIASPSQAANVGPFTMTTVGASPATYRFSYYVQETVLGAACTSSTTITLNLIFTDPLNGAPVTASESVIIANGGNGVVGAAYPWTALNQLSPFIFDFRAAIGTVIQYSATYNIGATCAPGPQYKVFPLLEQMTAN